VRDQWKGSNIDLAQFSEGVKLFFTERQFETELKKTRLGYEIEAQTEKILNAQLKISVSISGEPNDFTVGFVANKNRGGFYSPSMIISYILTALGGGAIFRGELKLQEALDKLEKAFWEHVDNQIAQLTRPTLHE
jgi:hypothetical protein